MKQQKQHVRRRLLALILTVTMVLGMIPASVMATGSVGTDDFGLSSLTVAMGTSGGWDSGSNQTEISLGEEFDSSVTEYEAPKLEYSNKRTVFVKAEATTEGAIITASLGNVTANVTSGAESWTGLVQVSPTGYVLGNPFDANAVNELKITVTVGEESKVYTVKISMKPEFKFTTNLGSGGWFNNEDDLELSVAVNSAIPEEDVTYQWYEATEKNTEHGIAIDNATNSTLTIERVTAEDQLGNEDEAKYYYVVAKCDGYSDIVSKIQKVVWTDLTKPESITLKLKVGDTYYDIPNGNWSEPWALVQSGDTFQLAALDQNGELTPVSWSSNEYAATIDENGVLTVQSGSLGTSSPWPKATSKFSGGPNKENNLVLNGYDFSSKNISMTLSKDGQKDVTVGVNGGYNGYTKWSVSEGYEQLATLETELKESKNGTSIRFTGLRPGSFTVTYELADLEANEISATKGENFADNNGKSESVTVTINGVAVEDAEGNLRETRMEISQTVTSPAIQLKAYTAADRTVAEWKSSDEAVATVDENGVVTACGAGNTIISAVDDQGAEGGIKVIVNNADIPYFENFAFTKANMSWNPGIYGLNFKATTLEYTGLTCTAATNDIDILSATIFDDEKYTVTATYSDWHGNDMVIPVKSGEATTLEDIFFGEGTITVTLQSKEDPELKTVYTFGITRAWDTQKQIKSSNGISVVADGRELSANLYEGRAEGFVFRANADGTLMGNLYTPTNTHYNYRSFLQNGLERFALNIVGNTDYVHIRYSSDDGETWYDLNQGGGQTRMFEFPERESDTNPVMKVMIQILDDKTYAENVAAEKDGFDGASPNVYTVWVEQLPATGMEMTEAILSHGTSYPAFDKETYSYNIMVNADEEAPTLTFKVSEGGAVSVGGTVLTANEDGSYTITLTKNYQSIVITNELGSATYQFRYTSRGNSKLPDKITDYLPINSQYTNQAQYGLTPEKTLTATNDVLSLGNFGGHITYYYEEALIDDPNNKYGIDFYITGNAFVDQSTGTGKGSMEPGQVWVSEDGEIWYALAGSEHYEDTTLWDYEVTYKKTELGMTSWKDNKGNQDNGKQVGQWPSTANYPLNDQISDGEVTLRGILIPCNDGSLTGNGTFNSFSKGAKFGYVDVLVNSRDGEDANPYLENDDYELESSGFDLAWAVDEDGLPVDVSEKEFHYVKIVTASNLWAGAANEKSTEVGNMFRTTAQETDMGVTASPTGVTITDGTTTETIEFEDGTQVYELNLTEMQYVSISVDGASADDNIYINNQRVEADEAAEGIQVTKNGKLVRVIVQNGDKAPVIYVLKLKSLAEDSLISAIKVDALGVDKVAETKDGKTYTVEVGHRVDVTSIDVTVPEGTEVTVDGEAVKESYSLEEGDNTFEITAVSDEAIQTVTLIVNKEKAPEVTGKITVSFTLLGDDNHGDVTKETGTHTLKSKNLETWISKTKYTIDAPANVLDLLEVALTEHDIDWVNVGGNYISEINGLAEFDNGPLSGWMYTIDGKHPERGVFVQPLENGDNVVFHYTDDYTVEEGSEKYGNSAYVEEVIPEETVLPFTDVAADIWYRNAVEFAYTNKLFSGVSATEFGPNVTMNRAMLVTVLHKMAGNPEADSAATAFGDVPSGKYYSDAVKWAVSKGLVSGYSDGNFGPSDPITRQQLAFILWNYSGKPEAEKALTNSDAGNISSYAKEAMQWAVENGVMSGRANGQLDPKGAATRAEVAQMFKNYIEKVVL